MKRGTQQLREKSVEQGATEKFVLDRIPKIDTLGDDLRDHATGKLDAKKVSELFKIKLSSLADAARSPGRLSPLNCFRQVIWNSSPRKWISSCLSGDIGG
jgi:hypothetical protein